MARSLAQACATAMIHALSRPPAFRIYGRANYESDWHVIDVFATHRRDADARWPLWSNTCITWTCDVIAVGADFAEQVLREQSKFPVSREHPCSVIGGRLRDVNRRRSSDGLSIPLCSEIMAHECGHTAQARRLSAFYWPIVGSLTLFREGQGWIHHFENQASETGLFGGIVSGSITTMSK